MRQFGLRMKFKTRHNFDLPLFFNISKQFLILAPGGLSAECVQVSVM